MAKARVIEATRHPTDGDIVARVVVQFSTDAGASLGFRTIDLPTGATQADLRAAVLVEWNELRAGAIDALIGQEWTLP